MPKKPEIKLDGKDAEMTWLGKAEDGGDNWEAKVEIEPDVFLSLEFTMTELPIEDK